MSQPPAFCDISPACEERFTETRRRVEDLERALRERGGIWDTLKKLELDLVRFQATVVSSVRTAAGIGSALGAVVGALFGAAVAIGIALLKG